MTAEHRGAGEVTRPGSARARAWGGSLLAAGLLIGMIATGMTAPPAAAEAAAETFAAPAQRAAVHFDSPRQRTPVTADASPAATSSDGPTDGRRAGGAAQQQPAGTSATVVDSLTDPATGLGPTTAARIPDETGQVLIASGADDESTDTTLSLWERSGDRWHRTQSMTGRNGGNGWREDRREGDRTSPAGVFTLSDAGGYLEDPGALLPYHRDEGLRSGAEAVYGKGYASVFDYVIAIDYNRRTGVPPTDNTRPDGWDAGGKIWLHVEHGSPTRGCVALTEDDMRALLTTLDPDQQPRIAMGSEEYLAQ